MNEFTISDNARVEALEERVAELERTQAEQAQLMRQQVMLTNRVMAALETVAEWKDAIERIAVAVDLNTKLAQQHATKIGMLCDLGEQTAKTLATHRIQLDRLSGATGLQSRGTVN